MRSEIDAQIDRLKQSKSLPRHVAIIMDGNGRWAKQRNLPRLQGHREGRESVRTVVRTAAKIGIPYLTLYTFSLENWRRSREEVEGLMMFLEQVLRTEYEELDENGVQLRAIGSLDLLPLDTRRALDETMARLRKNDRLVLTLALSYGGRAEIVSAVRRIAERVRDGEMDADRIDENTIRDALYDPELPDPDLLIRTSGEMRVSNFLLWQIAYTEIYVTDVLWPDFREKSLIESIEAYQKRERRFGL
ncbi:MAG: isoprenyl transferase [Candidatus Krumholzibacteriota bacterium]|nr:isoprenyl transferase [Candidatus Krumholzibacteriota bacterium]